MSPIPFSDELIEIPDDSIRLRDYYFPRGPRTVDLSAIERVEVLAPTLINGRWRIHGTGDLRTWFPRDPRRPGRDRVFVAHLRGRWRRIGCTAKDSAAVVRVLRARNTDPRGSRRWAVSASSAALALPCDRIPPDRLHRRRGTAHGSSDPSSMSSGVRTAAVVPWYWDSVTADRYRPRKR